MTTRNNDYETNPYTKRMVKKCEVGEERLPRENGNFKTFNCYKKCKTNQLRNMGTMRCRKQKQDYDLYPSPSSFHGSNDMRKTKKQRTQKVDYNVYPSQSSIRGSNDLRKTKNSRPSKSSMIVDYNVYPSSPSVKGSNTMSKKTKLKLKLDTMRNKKTIQKGRDWFWGVNQKRR